MKIPKYPEEFFDFSDGVDISNKRINEIIQGLVERLSSDEDISSLSSSTGNTKVEVFRDDIGCIVVEVYKNYQRKLIEPIEGGN